MRIGIVNDSLMAREALRRAVVSAGDAPGRLAGLRRRRGDPEGGRRHPRRDPDGPDHAGHRRRRGDPPDHAAGAVPDPGRHRHGERAPRPGVRGDGPRGARRRRHAVARADRQHGRGVAAAAEDRHHRQAGRPEASAPRSPRPAPAAPDKARPERRPVSWNLVVIGASTGGPAAVATVLRDMPDSPDASTVIIQHVDVAFAPGLARWLADRTGRRVDLAEAGDATAARPGLPGGDQRSPDPRRYRSIPLRRRADRRALSPVGRRVHGERWSSTGPSPGPRRS